MNLSSVIAEKMLFGGDCLAKIGGKSVFIPFAVPGERLEIEIVKSFADYDQARIVRVLEPSPHRTAPACPLYQKCGGCDMMHVESGFQTELKKKILMELLERAGVAFPEIQVVSGEPLVYRSRFQLHDGGMEERSSNAVVPIPACPVAVPQINEWLKETPAQDRPKGKGFLFGSPKAQPSLSFALESPAPRAQKAKAEPRQKGKKKHGNKKPASRFAERNCSLTRGAFSSPTFPFWKRPFPLSWKAFPEKTPWTCIPGREHSAPFWPTSVRMSSWSSKAGFLWSTLSATWPVAPTKATE